MLRVREEPADRRNLSATFNPPLFLGWDQCRGYGRRCADDYTFGCVIVE